MRSIRKLLYICTVCFLSFSLCLTSYAHQDRCQWYLKKHKGCCPGFPKEALEMPDYNAFYLDTSASQKREKILYLTFDAGYDNGNIERILDTLKAESVPAAFFLLDNIILKNTDIVTRMAEEGHLVCNHTKNHKDLSSSSYDEIERNLMALEKIYKEKTGKEMAKYFRFPEGKYSIRALDHINKMGYKTIFWSFAYDDWDNCRQPDRERAIKKILDYTHEGAVILLHPTSKTNADILPTLIREWRSMGYSFGTLDQLTAK